MESDAEQLPLSHKTWAWFEANRKQTLLGAGGLLLLGVIVAAFLYWQDAADVARAVIVIIGEYPADFTIPLDARCPIVLISLQLPILLYFDHRISLLSEADELLDVFLIGWLPALFGLLQFLTQRLELLLEVFHGRVRRRGRQRLAEIGVDAPAVAAGVESCQHALAVRSHR